MHYVIGDVHGCYDEMMRLIQKIESQDENPVIYFVGDFIDRGPQVVETLNWMMDNIMPGGKYQSVMGNHEDMVLTYWNQVKNEWVDDSDETIEKLPGLPYGFDEKLKAAGLFTRSYMENVVGFFQNLPLHIDLNITSSTGKTVDFTVAHAYLPNPDTDPELEIKESPRNAYLWSREHYWGYHNPDGRVLVHGHTCTTEHEYRLRHPRDSRPGMVVYASNQCINVDCGCFLFHYGEGMFYPCLLGGICLETLEEYYSHTLEERFEEYLIVINDKWYFEDPEAAVKYKVEHYWEFIQHHGFKQQEYERSRNEILAKLGLK